MTGAAEELALLDSGVIKISQLQEQTVGVFFVWKSDGVTLRLILDTRAINGHFHEPEYCQLPTPAAWQGLRTPAGGTLNLAQVDVEKAFYRIDAPPGLERSLCLPRVSADHLRQLRPGMSLPVGRYLTPQLVVLAMGWSWSLFFCQKIVGRSYWCCVC